MSSCQVPPRHATYLVIITNIFTLVSTRWMARDTRLEQETSLAYSSEAKRERTFQCQDIRFALMRMNWIKSKHLSENLEKLGLWKSMLSFSSLTEANKEISFYDPLSQPDISLSTVTPPLNHGGLNRGAHGWKLFAESSVSVPPEVDTPAAGRRGLH